MYMHMYNITCNNMCIPCNNCHVVINIYLYLVKYISGIAFKFI